MAISDVVFYDIDIILKRYYPKQEQNVKDFTPETIGIAIQAILGSTLVTVHALDSGRVVMLVLAFDGTSRTIYDQILNFEMAKNDSYQLVVTDSSCNDWK